MNTTTAAYKVLTLILCLLVSACATMMSGSTQKIKVSCAPDATTVTAEPGGYRVITPAELTLPREKGPYTLKFEKEGYKSVEITLKRETNGWVWGNLLVGGLIGVMIDYGNGSAYKLSPDKVHAHLEAAGSKPVVDDKDTLLIFDQAGVLLIAIKSW